MEQDSQVLDYQIEEQIDELWADRDAVKLVEYYDGIGKEARQIMRYAITHNWKLKPLDAIHLATAKVMEVSEFHTYDEKLDKFSEELGFTIKRPHTSHPRLLE